MRLVEEAGWGEGGLRGTGASGAVGWWWVEVGGEMIGVAGWEGEGGELHYCTPVGAAVPEFTVWP